MRPSIHFFFKKKHSNHSPHFPVVVLLDKSFLGTIIHLGSQCVLHEGTEGVNAGDILLFHENTQMQVCNNN